MKKQIKKTTIKSILFICEVLDILVFLGKKLLQEAIQYILAFSFLAIVAVGMYVSFNWVNDNVFDPFNHWYHVERFEINE